jgi:hypothetical protein
MIETETLDGESPTPMVWDAGDEQLLAQLAGRAAAKGLSLAGEGGFLQQMTRLVLQAGLEAEMTSHLGYDKHAAEGRNGGNSRNGTRTKTVITEVGPVDLEVLRDREGTFAPVTVAKRVRRLRGVDEMVISLVARGMGTGDVQAHLAEVYGTNVSRQQISDITDAVVEKMAEWQNRPLDVVYPVIFIDAIHVKIRDGMVANRPIYVALAVTCEPAVDRAQQGVDVHERPLLDPGQHLRGLGQGDQVAAQDRGQLTGVPVGELPQEDPEGGRGVHPAEEVFHPPGSDHVQVLDAVRSGGHPRDDPGQLRCRVRRPRPHPLISEPDVLLQQARKPGLLGRFQHRDQPRVRHEILFVEHRAVRAPGMRCSHRKCPSRL